MTLVYIISSFKYSFERTQSNTWLEDYHFMDVYRLSKRLSKITDLQITSPLVDSLEKKLPAPFHEQLPFVEAEPLQVGFIIIKKSIIPNKYVKQIYV